MKALLALIFASLLMSSSCNKENAGDCQGDLVCTQDFRSVHVQVMNSTAPYQLDHYITKRHSDSMVIDIHSALSAYEDSLFRAQGTYPVLNDGHMQLTSRQGTGFTFIGYVNNLEVIRENYVIGHDCCHIVKISGRAQVNL
ncbi:MAG: hypothetical protein WAT19_00465 [Ferruginibacter sp.]